MARRAVSLNLQSFSSRLKCCMHKLLLLFRASLSINIVSVSANGVDLSPIPSVGLSVCLCVQKVYCGKMADLALIMLNAAWRCWRVYVVNVHIVFGDVIMWSVWTGYRDISYERTNIELPWSQGRSL